MTMTEAGLLALLLALACGWIWVRVVTRHVARKVEEATRKLDEQAHQGQVVLREVRDLGKAVHDTLHALRVYEGTLASSTVIPAAVPPMPAPGTPATPPPGYAVKKSRARRRRKPKGE